jgi:hypothetical protein
MRRWLWRVLAAGLTLAPVLAASHALNSAQWQLSQRDARTWDSRLRLPEDMDGRLLSLQPYWPEGCERTGELRVQPADEGSVAAWTLRCPELLRGHFGLDGFSLQLPDAVLRFQPLDQPPQHVVLSATRPAWTVSAAESPPPVLHYLGLGVHHILLGPDHLLFVLGLWALWRRSGRGLGALVGTLTAFTAAHSITLAGTALGGWSLPSAAVEASIAASILLLAVELASGQRGVVERRPAAVAFAFGLLHGFGFAGALLQIGLPEQAQVMALAAFNVGVEFGQIAFVAALMIGTRLLRPAPRFAPALLCLYGAIAAHWLLDRSAAVFW